MSLRIKAVLFCTWSIFAVSVDWHVVMASIRASKAAEPAWMVLSGVESVWVSMSCAALEVCPVTGKVLTVVAEFLFWPTHFPLGIAQCTRRESGEG